MSIEPALGGLAPVQPEPAGTGDEKRGQAPGEAGLQPTAPEGDGECGDRRQCGGDGKRRAHRLAGLGQCRENAKAEGAGNRPGPKRGQASRPKGKPCGMCVKISAWPSTPPDGEPIVSQRPTSHVVRPSPATWAQHANSLGSRPIVAMFVVGIEPIVCSSVTPKRS